jgi:hypothetical protein
LRRASAGLRAKRQGRVIPCAQTRDLVRSCGQSARGPVSAQQHCVLQRRRDDSNSGDANLSAAAILSAP